MKDSVQELRDGAGSMYDPKLVNLFIRNIDQLEAEASDAVKNMSELSFQARAKKLNPGAQNVRCPEIHPCAGFRAGSDCRACFAFRVLHQPGEVFQIVRSPCKPGMAPPSPSAFQYLCLLS